MVFGPEDEFFNRFAALARLFPGCPLIGGGRTQFQPVFVGDVAKAVVAALTGKAQAGAVYELGGPEILSMKEVMERVLAYTMRKRMLVTLPFPLAKLQGAMLQLLPNAAAHPRPGAPAREGQCGERSRQARSPHLEGLGIDPVAVEAVVPDYLEHIAPRAMPDYQP